MQIRRDSVAFVVLLGALAALPPLSIDMGLPALPAVGAALRTRPDLAGLTLSLFMAGFACGPVLYGPLSDRHGRKPVLLAGLALFTVAGLAAALAPSIGTLLAARLLQGAGAGSGTSMAFAIVRDLFEAHEARRRLSYVTAVLTAAPLVAPTLGAAVLAFGGWRAIYGALALGGAALVAVVFLGLAESVPRGLRTRQGRVQGGVLDRVLAGYRAVLGSPVSLGFALVYAFGFGVQFSYVSGSPLVMMGLFGVSARTYGLLFGCTALGITAGALTNGQLSARQVSPVWPLRVGLGLLLGAGLVLVVLTAAGLASVITLMPPLVASSYGYGLVGPNASHGALEPVPEVAGTAGAVLTSAQMGTGALASALVASLFGVLGLYAMAGMMALCAAVATLVYAALVRPTQRASAAAGRARPGRAGE